MRLFLRRPGRRVRYRYPLRRRFTVAVARRLQVRGRFAPRFLFLEDDDDGA